MGKNPDEHQEGESLRYSTTSQEGEDTRSWGVPAETRNASQERYCFSCNLKHIGLRPKIKARIEAEKQKRNIAPKAPVKLYGGSTLRGVDVFGLRAEVLTMSGAGLGQVIRAMIDDPERYQCQKAILFGGINDMRVENFTNNEDFASNIELSLTKLNNHAQTMPDKTFYLVQQIPEVTGSTNQPECRMNDLADSVSNIDTISLVGWYRPILLVWLVILFRPVFG